MYIHFHYDVEGFGSQARTKCLACGSCLWKVGGDEGVVGPKNSAPKRKPLKRGWFKNKVDEDQNVSVSPKELGIAKRTWYGVLRLTMLGKVNWRFIRIFRLKLVHEKALRKLIHAFV